MASGDKQRGAQFDILDKALASRLHELLSRDFIYRQDYDHWMTGYNQLAAYARENSDVTYVARQWAMEQKNYQGWPERLAAKIRTANPVNYDTTISTSGKSGCDDCWGGSKIPQLPYQGVGGITINSTPMLPRTPTPLGGGSLGDSIRGLFNPPPFFEPPQPPLIQKVKNDTVTGIIVALIVGGILWGVHYLSKKAKLNAG